MMHGNKMKFPIEWNGWYLKASSMNCINSYLMIWCLVNAIHVCRQNFQWILSLQHVNGLKRFTRNARHYNADAMEWMIDFDFSPTLELFMRRKEVNVSSHPMTKTNTHTERKPERLCDRYTKLRAQYNCIW